MKQIKRIPLAWSTRWRRVRRQVIPAMCIVFALIGSGWLWERQGGVVHGIGEVDALRIDVTSPTTGLVVDLPHGSHGQWRLYDHVLADEVLARFDDQPLQRDKKLLRLDVNLQLKKMDQWQSATTESLDASENEAVLKLLDFERARLTALKSSLTGDADAAPLGSAESDAGAPDLPDGLAEPTRTEVERWRDDRHGFEVRGENLRRREETLSVRAPITGTLVAVYCWPGQTIPSGGLIATIAADYARHIVSYLPEKSSIVPEPGTRVTIRSPGNRSVELTTEVEQVGRQIEPIPARHLADFNALQWGLPLRIKIPAEANFRPGALVDVIFHRTDGQRRR